MKNGYAIIDSDLHLYEPADLWDKRLEGRFRGRVTGLARTTQETFLRIDGEQIPPVSEENAAVIRAFKEANCERFAAAAARGYDAVSQLEVMDTEGVDLAVLFPTRGTYAICNQHHEPELALAIARAYNDWLAEFCAQDPTRLFAAAMLPPQAPELAAREIVRVMKEYSVFRAAYFRPNPVNDTYWHHPCFDVVWATLQELDIPVCFHEGGPSLLPYTRQAGSDRLGTLQLLTCFSHPGEMMQACIAFCLGGVFERFPRLRAGFLEGNCSWLPWLLWRMDGRLEGMARDVELPKLSLKPSEYFRRQGFVSVDCDEETATHAIAQLDAENIVFSTDFPHVDCKYPHAVETFFQTHALSPAQIRKVLSENCCRLYGFDPAKLPAAAPAPTA